MNRILIIGGTGNVGGQVLGQLLAEGATVRALVRNPEDARVSQHAELAGGDLTRPETLDPSLDGVNTVFLVWTAPAAAVVPALERITRRVERIVFLSSPYKTPHPFFQGGQPNLVAALHAQIEALIEASGSQWTFLRPGIFAENARHWWGPSIRAGDLVRWPYLAAPTAPVHERDLAAVAVRTLCDDGHAAAEYVLTGPESLTQAEQIAAIGHAIGRPLRAEEISPEEARHALQAMNMPIPVVNMLLNAWAAALGQPAFVTTTIEAITGTPARTFSAWAADHAADFQG